MTTRPPSRGSATGVLLLAVWIAVWAVIGTLSFIEVRALTSLSGTMDYAGQSLDEAGQTLNALAAIPLIGSGVRPAAQRVQELASSTIQEARNSRTHIARLSVLAVLVGGVIPIGLGIAFFVAFRHCDGARRRG